MEKELISLNPEYNNIPLNETAKCMGRMIDKLQKGESYATIKRKDLYR